MRDDRSRLLDRARRIDAVLAALRRHAAAQERERQRAPADVRGAMAELGSARRHPGRLHSGR
jgi:hypothetical protein